MAKYDADALFQELDRRNSADFAPPPVAYTPPRLPGETPPAGKYNADALFQELDRRNSTTSMWEPVQMAINSASYGDGVTQAKLDKTRFDLNKWVGEQAIPVNKYTHAEAQRQLQRAQMDHILRDSPHTARWFTEQVQQGKTPYDVGTLASIERVTRVAPLLPHAAARGAYRTVGGLVATPGAFADVVGQALEPVFGKLPKSELTNIGEFITEYGRKVTGSVPDNLTIGEKGLVAGVESLGANLTTFGMAPFGLQATLATMSTSVGGSTYLENLKATDSPAIALLHGILDAGYEYIFEWMGGTGVLFDKAAWAKGLLGLVAKFAAREIPTELATTVAQKADQYILQNPERTFEQFMSELPEDLAVTAIATLVGGGGQVALFKAVDKLADLGNTTAKTQAAHDNLTALLDNVAKSELYLNDPGTFAQFFQGVAGDATVTVDPVKLVEAMTAANITEEALPSLKDQLNAPGEIELTVQELATAFAGTGAETTLLQHVRPEPDLPTLAESKEQTKAAFEAFQAAGEKAMAKFQADEVANAALDAIQEDVAADVQATGMFGPHYARGYGTLMRHFYATMAKAHGVTPLQFRDGWVDANGIEHRGYNPRVIGPAGQVRGRSPATTTDFKPGRVANLRNRDDWAVLEAGNPNGTEATPEENAASMAKLKAYLDGEGIEYHDAKGSYFGTKADSLMLLGVTPQKASEIGNLFGQESVATRHGLVYGDGTVAQATGVREVNAQAANRPVVVFESEQTAAAIESTNFNLPEGYSIAPDRGQYGFSGKMLINYEGEQVGYINTWFDHTTGEVRIDKAELDAAHQGKRIAKLAYTGINKALSASGLGTLGSDTRSMTQSAINMWKSLVRDGVARERKDGRIGYEFIPEKGSAVEDHTFLPAFGSAFRLEIPESAFENRVKLNEVLNQSVSTRTPTAKSGRGDPHLTTDLDVDYNVVEQDADLVARMATVVKTYPGIKKGLRNPNKIVEAFIKHVEDNLSWLYDNVPPEIRERSKLWYDGGRRIIERWVDKYGFTDAQIAGVIAVLSPQTEWDMNVTRAERILDIWTQQQDFAWSDEMNAEADAIDSIKPVLREAIRGKKLSELDSDLLRGVWIRVYDQAHNPRVVRGITPEGGFAAFKKTMAGKVKTSTWGSFAEIGKAVRILRGGSIPNISRSLGNEHKVRNFYNNLFDPSDSRSVTIDTHAVAAGLLRPLVGGSIEVSDNLGARPRHAPTGTNGTYVLYAEAYRRVAMAKGVLPRELQSITWEAVRRLFPDNYKSDATRAEIDALWKPNETGKESADEIRNKILDNRGGRIPNPAWERSGTGLDVGQPSSTYQSGILERSWADGTPGTRAGGYFAQTVPATGKPAGLTITGVHFSPGEQTSLLPSKYGKGLEGAERARVMASKDARIKRRAHFYVNTGQGVFPEAGTGGKAHVSELTNLYDADVDALGLFKGKADEQLNAAESAVLDAGYSGYVMRGFGNQGAAVVFGARVGDPGKPDAEVLRPVVVTGTDLMGDGRGFTEFFSEASKGNRAPEEPYKPVLDIGEISEFSEEYVKHRGNFDDHIASSIPGFREVQQIVGDAIVKAFPNGAVLLDLGASEGAFGKAITAVSGGAVRTLSLDPNLEMANFFSEHSQVPGADYVVAAVGSADDAGKTAWTEGDTPIPFFAPTQAYDVVHEAMVFQFISNGRNAQVARVKEMLKPGGVAFFEEKTADDSPEFVANEAQKDAFKNQFFSKRQIAEKNKEVLARGAEVVAEEEKKREQNTVGMNDLMTTRKELEAVLLRNFKHVVQYWDSGNFAGYMASDDPKVLKKLEGGMLSTDSEFAAVSTPRKVTSPEPLAPREGGISTKFVGGKEEANAPVAPAAQYSETQRLRQALTTSKDLPHGAMTAARWREYIGKVLPDLLPKIEASGAFGRVQGMVYRDELARAIEPPEGQFYQSGWYSPLTRAFQNVKQAAMPGSQWASWLAGNKAKLGLKDDEIVFSGLDNYLELRGKDKVTREEIVDYLSGNGVRVEETVLGGAQGITEKDLDNAEVEARRTGDWTAYEDLTRRYEDEQIGNNANDSGNKTLYASYVPPGGIPGTYREILVVLPEKGRAEFERIKAKVDNDEPLTPEENEIYGTYEPGADVYRSHHWNGVPNVLVHLRVDEVEGADGQRVLRVIEVQSDWGQQGKKEGFVSGENTVRRADIMEEMEKLARDRDPRTNAMRDEKRWHELAKERDALSAVQGLVPPAPFVTDTKAWVALGIKRAIMHAVDVGATGVVFATGEQNAALYSLEKQVDKIEVWPQSGQPGTFVVTAWKNGSVVSSEKNVSEEKLPDVIGKEPARAAMADLQKRNGRLGVVEGLDLKVGGEGMKAFYDKIVPQVANDVLKKLGAGVKVEKFTVPTPVDEATTDRALVMDEDIEHFGFRITPEFRAKVMEGVPLFQVKPAYAVRSPDGKYQGIRELTDKEARELIDLGYQVNRVTPGYGQAENAMGGFNPTTLEITLLAKANPSTFLHETGHFFLTAYADMAAQEGAPQQVVDDMGAILKWFGIEANPGGMPGEGGAGGTFAQTATSAFKKWFGDSKVVDPEGRPLVVYHGSTRGGIRHATIQHSFFTPSRAVARTYSEDDYKEGDTPVVQEVFLRMENPLIVDAYGSAWMHIPFEGERYTTDSLANLAKKRGYDGVIIKNIEDNVNDEDLPPSDVYITLGGRAQIKSATSNLGTFDPSNSDILKQGGAPGTRGPLPYGRTPLEVWNAMSVDQQRPYHEQFAESFEQYLFSGKAPTRELQSLFRRFATWLTKVYGSIKEFIAGHPGAQLNPDLAAIMDRMLATEEEIKQAEDNRNYEALFRTAAEAGMTPAQFAAYLDLPEEARAVAEEQLRTRSLRDMKWLQNRKNKTVAALQKEAAAARAEVRKEVAETVAQEPIFRALRWLKRGELTNPDTGEEVKVTAGNKLSIPALEEMYPEGALGDKPDWRSLGYGQYGMLANEGLHPDVVADMFGFDSGAALVDALVNAPKFKDEVEGRADQIMLERHGDLSSPDKIAQAADEAIHNEARTKIVATELSFLDKLTGSPSFLIKAAKEYARQLVANRTSKTLKAWVFAADEVRASKAAAAALKKGDTKAAANHKRVELLNHAAVREAHSAEKELKKIVDRLRKIASYKDDDSSAKARDMDMVNAVRVVLYRFGLGTERKGKTATEYLSLVEANDPAMGAALRDLVDSTTDSAKDWRDLKLSELRDLRDAVESVWALAKRSRQMEVDGKLVPRRQVEQELYDRLDEIGIPDRLPGEGQAVTEAERNWMKFATFVAALRRVESWVGAKDGKAMGPFRKYIWSQIKDAADTYRVKKAEYLKAYRELLDTIAPTLKRELIDAREIGYTFGKGEGGMGMVELLHAILHTGNASNKRKLLLGRGWATDNGDGTMDTSKWDAFITRMIQEGKLTKAHYDFAQGVWDMLDGMKPAAQKAHRSVFGRYFAEVTADAFTTPFGDYRGGYVPAQADPEIVQDAQLKELANQENENMVYAFPSTPRGFTKSRVEYNRPLRLDLRSLAGHIDKVLLFSYLTEPVSDVRRVILSKTVSQALGRVDPKAIGSILTPWLNRTAKQIVEDRVPGREPLARFWSAARARAGMSAMFANLANSAQQITGVSLAALKVRPKYLLEALAHGVASPRKLSDHVASVSPYMRDRMHNDVVLMGEAIDEILLNPTLLQSAKAWSAKHAYFMQRAVDNFFSPMVWMGAFNQAKENGSDDLEARRLADSAVRETQGSQAPEDIAAFEQGTAFYRMFVQFAGYFNMNANLLGTEFVKLSQDMGLKKGAGRGLYVLALGFYVPAVLGELIIQAFRGGPDDDDKDGEYLDDWLAAVFGYGPARYLTAMAPVVGQAANALVNTLNHKPYDDRISTAPAISMIESAVKAPISVYKAIADEGKSTKAVNDTATLISMTVGVPARAVAKPISYLTGVANEEIAPEDTYDAIRGTITGTASPGSKQ